VLIEKAIVTPRSSPSHYSICVFTDLGHVLVVVDFLGIVILRKIFHSLREDFHTLSVVNRSNLELLIAVYIDDHFLEIREVYSILVPNGVNLEHVSPLWHSEIIVYYAISKR